MKQNDIRGIALGTIIVLVLFAVGSVSPFLGSLCTFCIPLPVIFYRVKLGRTAGLIISTISFVIILAMVRGFKFELMFTVQLILIGFMLGEGFSQRRSVNQTFLGALIAAIAIMGLWVFVASTNAEQSPNEMLSGMLDANIAMTMNFYRTQGLSAQDIATLEEMFTMAKPWVIKFLPSAAVLIYMFTIWANILLARTILSRAKLPWPYASFESWSVPANLVFVALAAAVVWLVAPKGGGLWLIGLSALLILMPAYCFQGLAILINGMGRMALPKPLQIVVYVVIMIFWPLIIIVSLLPFFDMWFNFRNQPGKTA